MSYNLRKNKEKSFAKDESFLPADLPVPTSKDKINKRKARKNLLDLRRLPNHITPVSLLAQTCASIFLHYHGLAVFLEADGRFLNMLGAVFGSGLEGVLLMNIVMTLMSKRHTWANVIAFFLSVQSVIFLLVSVIFMKKTGLPDLPDMFVIISGVRESRSFIKGEASNDTREFILSILGACAYCGPAALLIWRETQRRNKDAAGIKYQKEDATEKIAVERTEQHRRTVNFFVFLFLANVVLYCANAWMPIFHTYASLCGSFFFSPPGSSYDIANNMLKADHGATLPKDSKKIQSSDRPNLILLIHESLTGEYTMARKASVPLMPFFQKSYQSDDGEFFLFENSRSVSGDTPDAMTGKLL